MLWFKKLFDHLNVKYHFVMVLYRVKTQDFVLIHFIIFNNKTLWISDPIELQKNKSRACALCFTFVGYIKVWPRVVQPHPNQTIFFCINILQRGNVSCILLRTSNFNWISFVDIIEIYRIILYIKNWTAIWNIFITYTRFIAKTCLVSFKQVLTFMKVDQKPPFWHFRIKSNYEMSWHIKIKVRLNECLTFSLTRKGGVID